MLASNLPETSVSASSMDFEGNKKIQPAQNDDDSNARNQDYSYPSEVLVTKTSNQNAMDKTQDNNTSSSTPIYLANLCSELNLSERYPTDFEGGRKLLLTDIFTKIDHDLPLSFRKLISKYSNGTIPIYSLRLPKKQCKRVYIDRDQLYISLIHQEIHDTFNIWSQNNALLPTSSRSCHVDTLEQISCMNYMIDRLKKEPYFDDLFRIFGNLYDYIDVMSKYFDPRWVTNMEYFFSAMIALNPPLSKDLSLYDMDIFFYPSIDLSTAFLSSLFRLCYLPFYAPPSVKKYSLKLIEYFAKVLRYADPIKDNPRLLDLHDFSLIQLVCSNMIEKTRYKFEGFHFLHDSFCPRPFPTAIIQMKLDVNHSLTLPLSDKVSGLFGRFTSRFTTPKDVVVPPVESEGINFIPFAEFSMLIYNLYSASSKKHFVSILGMYLITKKIAKNTVDSIIEWFSTKVQSDSGNTFFGGFTALFCSLYSSVQPTTRDIKKFIVESGNLARAFTNINTFVSKFPEIIKNLINFIYRLVTGKNYFSPKDDKDFVELEIRVQSLISRKNMLSSSYSDEDDLNEYHSLLVEVGSRLKVSRGTQMEIEWSRLELLLRSHMKVTPPAEQPDQKAPFLLYLYGDSQIGKSDSVDRILTDLIFLDEHLTEVERLDRLENYSKYKYVRNVVTEFEDGLTPDKKYVVYDDFGQKRDMPGVPNPEFLEIIQTSNVTPRYAHMANLSQKGRVVPKYDIIVCTSNVEQPPGIESITTPQALLNRISENKVHVQLKPFFQDNDGRLDKERAEWFDVEKTPSFEKKRMFIYEFYLNIKGEEKKMTYDELIDELSIRYNTHNRRQDRRMEQISEYRNILINNLKASLQSNDEVSPVNIKFIKKLIIMVCDMFPSFKDQIATMTNMFGETLYDFGLGKAFKPDKVHKDLLEGFMELSGKKMDERINKYLIHTTPATIVAMNSYYQRYSENENRINDIIRKKFFKDHPWLSTIMHASTAIALTGLCIGGTICIVLAIEKILRWFTDEPGAQREMVSVIIYSIQNGFGDYQPYVQAPNDTEKRMYPLSKICNEFCGLQCIDLSESCLPTSLPNNSIIQGYTGYMTFKKTKTSQSFRDLLQKPAKVQSFPRSSPINVHQFATPQYLSEEEFKIRYMTPKQKLLNTKIESLSKNQFVFGIFTETGSRCYVGSTLAICNKIFCMPAHFMFGSIKTIVLRCPNKTDVVIDDDYKVTKLGSDTWMTRQEFLINYDGDKDKDAILVDFSSTKELPSSKSIISDFVESVNVSKKTDSVSVLLPLRNLDADFKQVEIHTRIKPLTTSYPMADKKLNFQRVLSQGFEYESATILGDCGSPVVSYDHNCITIVGIHVALSEKAGLGLAECVTRDLINSSMKPEPATLQYLPTDEILGDGMKVLGKLENSIHVPRNTAYVKTKLYDPSCGELPSALRCKDGVDPLRLGIMKQSGKKSLLDLTSESEWIYQFYCKHKAQLPKPNYDSFFSMDQAIFGIKDDPLFKPLNLSSGAGFNWDRKNQTGKRAYIKGDHTTTKWICPTLSNAVLERITNAQNGIRIPTYYIDTLKDELRPVEKVENLNTRVFSYPQMDYVIACRMMFGPFMREFHRNYLTSGSLIGFNPFSNDMEFIHKKLNTHPNILAGDFKNWDANVRADFMEIVFNNYLIPWFKDNIQEFDAKFETALKILMIDLISATHICIDIVYEVDRGMPSGHPLTSILNTLYNMCMMYCIYMRKMPIQFANNFNFDNNIVSYFYGDDHAISVSDFALQFLNYTTLKKELEERYEFKYTSFDKTILIDSIKSHKLTDITLLKRRFHVVSGRIRGVLDFNNILTIPMFQKKKLNELIAVRTNVDTAMMEFCLYGKKTYDDHVMLLRSKMELVGYRSITDLFCSYESMIARLNLEL